MECIEKHLCFPTRDFSQFVTSRLHFSYQLFFRLDSSVERFNFRDEARCEA